MKRGPYAKVGARNRDLITATRRIKVDHPLWGYRRIWAYLRFVEQPGPQEFATILVEL